jgi:hypothetical protein
MSVKNSDLARALELQEQIKAMESELSVLKDKCKKIGTFSTKDFIVVIKKVEREQSPGVGVLKKCLGSAFKKIEKEVRKVEFDTVSIKRKAA